MKRVFLFILLVITKNLFSQIPNSSFEEWNNGNPRYWQTTNIPIVPASVVRDSNSYEGFLAVKGIVVSDIRNKPFAPYLGIYGPAAQGFHIDESYEHLNGWCRLFLNPGDRFIGDLKLYDSNQEPMAEGKIIIDTSIASWQPFKVQINYYGLLPPVSCTLYFTISDSTLLASGHIGSYFVLDELSLDGNVGISNPKNIETAIVYPNPVTSDMHIVNEQTANRYMYTLFDITGKRLVEREQTYAEEIINTENFLPGVYFLHGVSKDKIFTQKIILE